MTNRVVACSRRAVPVDRPFRFRVVIGAISEDKRAQFVQPIGRSAIVIGAGLVDVHTEGRHRFYSARKAELGPFVTWLEASWDDALYRLKLAAELERARRGPLPRRLRRRRRS